MLIYNNIRHTHAQLAVISLGVGLLQFLVQGEAVLEGGTKVAHLRLGPLLLVSHHNGRLHRLEHLTDLTECGSLLEVWIPLEGGGGRSCGEGGGGKNKSRCT